MANVGVPVRRHRIHVPRFLETQVVSHQSFFLGWIHEPGGIRNFRYCLVLRLQNRAGGSHPHVRHFRRPNCLRMPNQV